MSLGVKDDIGIEIRSTNLKTLLLGNKSKANVLFQKIYSDMRN